MSRRCPVPEVRRSAGSAVDGSPCRAVRVSTRTSTSANPSSARPRTRRSRLASQIVGSRPNRSSATTRPRNERSPQRCRTASSTRCRTGHSLIFQAWAPQQPALPARSATPDPDRTRRRAARWTMRVRARHQVQPRPEATVPLRMRVVRPFGQPAIGAHAETRESSVRGVRARRQATMHSDLHPSRRGRPVPLLSARACRRSRPLRWRRRTRGKCREGQSLAAETPRIARATPTAGRARRSQGLGASVPTAAPDANERHVRSRPRSS